MWSRAVWQEKSREEERVIPSNWISDGNVRWPKAFKVLTSCQKADSLVFCGQHIVQQVCGKCFNEPSADRWTQCPEPDEVTRLSVAHLIVG